MKLDKLARQIRRDISASPKKAAALGLMFLVALYFWAPMVWGWIAPGAKPKTVAAAGVILEDDPVDPVAQANKAKHVFHWEKIRKHIAADPRMTPAAFQASWHNPFRAAEGQTEDQARTPEYQAPAGTPQEIDPMSAGLTLSSVAVSAKLRSATISGDSYREGEVIKLLAPDGSVSSVEFKLVRVDYHEVELERQGKIFKLKLSRARVAHGDEISGSGQEGM